MSDTELRYVAEHWNHFVFDVIYKHELLGRVEIRKARKEYQSSLSLPSPNQTAEKE